MKTYSVSKVEKKAVELAKVIIKHFPEGEPLLSSDNILPLVTWLATTCKVSNGHIIAMLYKFLPMTSTPQSALRIAYAIMYYLPEFMDEEYKELDDKYSGHVKFQAHCKILESKPFIQNIEKGIIAVKIRAMLMTSLYAGMYVDWIDKESTISRVLRRIGMSGSKTEGERPPQAMTGAYVTITFGKTKEHAFYPVYIDVCSSERKQNQELTKLRRNKMCDISEECYKCYKGKDECYLACRLKTKKGFKNEKI